MENVPKNVRLLFSAREKILNSFESRLFLTKNSNKFQHVPFPTPEPETEPEVLEGPAIEPYVAAEPTKVTKAKAKRKISSLKLRELFVNEIKNEGKNIMSKYLMIFLIIIIHYF